MQVHKRLGSLGSGFRAVVALSTAMALSTATTGIASAAGGAKAQGIELVSPRGFSVVPVPGDRYVEPTTSLSFLNATVSQLSGLTVRGSLSGSHRGHLSLLIGAKGESFVPTKPFRPGETVTVTAPKLRMPAGHGDSYTFGIARPASPPAARKAFQVAGTEYGLGPSRAASTSSRVGGRSNSPPTCNVVRYKSEPYLYAQRVCMNLGVTTHGTPAEHLLFLTPGGNASARGEGIYEPNGHLVYWRHAPPGGLRDDNLSVVRFDGNRYLAIWAGTQLGAGYGNGYVYLYDDHYHLVGRLTTSGFPSDWIDMHEFQLTPQGDALIGIFEPISLTIGSDTETVLQYVVQKLSLVKHGYHISTGSLLFQWDSLMQVPVAQSQSPNPGRNGAVWDYFHGNAISQDSDGNLVISARNTWGIYKVDDTPGSPAFGRLLWQVGAPGAGDSTLAEPWCYQHDVVALGNGEYSLYDDGGTGPGCLLGSTAHPSRGLIISVDPNTNPATTTLIRSYTHSPAIYSGFTGSTERMNNGDVLIDWADNPEITEYNEAGTQVKMDMTLSEWSYRAASLPWQGYPTWRPSVDSYASGGKTDVWMSWNGSTEVTRWIVLAGPSSSQLTPIKRYWYKTSFETMATLGHVYPWIAVEAVSSSGQVLSRSLPRRVSGG